MDNVIRVIKEICSNSKCRNCILSENGICKAQDIMILFYKYWEDK